MKFDNYLHACLQNNKYLFQLFCPIPPISHKDVILIVTITIILATMIAKISVPADRIPAFFFS